MGNEKTGACALLICFAITAFGFCAAAVIGLVSFLKSSKDSLSLPVRVILAVIMGAFALVLAGAGVYMLMLLAAVHQL